jgi:hypothetical protein
MRFVPPGQYEEMISCELLAIAANATQVIHTLVLYTYTCTQNIVITQLTSADRGQFSIYPYRPFDQYSYGFPCIASFTALYTYVKICVLLRKIKLRTFLLIFQILISFAQNVLVYMSIQPVFIMPYRYLICPPHIFYAP